MPSTKSIRKPSKPTIPENTVNAKALESRIAILLLLIAPILFFAPVLFGGYTLSQNDLGVDRTHPYGGLGIVPIADPAGSSLMNEPYLVYLGRHLSRGRIPLLNMKNGLGAAGVESLVTGTFYVLNPVLLVLPIGKPLAYDLFIILHTCILLCGLYGLLRWYASPFAASVVAILVALSGVTHLWLNMESYRNFSWLPVMACGAIGVVRRIRTRRYAMLLVFATVACGTAGNIQEFGPALACTVLIIGCEYFGALPENRPPLRGVFICLFAGILIASPAFVPYFVSLKDGNLFVTNDPGRSVRLYNIVWLFSWVLPRVAGFYPFLFLRNVPYWPHSDLSTTGFLLLIAGTVYGWVTLRKRTRTPAQLICLTVPVVMILGFAKIVHTPVFDFVRLIPLLREFFFIKYYLYLFALASLPMAIGLDALCSLDTAARRRLIRVSAVIVGGVLAVIVVYLSITPGYSMHDNVPAVIRTLAAWTYAVSIGVAAIAIALLYWQPRHWQRWIMAMVLFQVVALFPPGFGKRLPAYPPDNADNAGKRLLTGRTPSTNLFFDAEYVTMYDAVINKYYRDFLLTFFQVANAGVIYQPTERELSATHLRALQLVGTSEIRGFQTAPGTEDLARATGAGTYAVLDPLPRAFVISRTTYESLKDVRISAASIESILEKLRADLAHIPQPTHIQAEDETIRVDVPQNPQGVLILNQAFWTYWRLGSRTPGRFLELWPSWTLDASTGESCIITYWPAGLTLAFVLMAVGLVLVILIVVALPNGYIEP